MATGGNKFEESFSQGNDEYYSIVCLPCLRDIQERIPAFGYCINCKEHLCHTCFNHHKKATPSRHHGLQDKDAMPSTQQHLTTPCPFHKKEIINLYCHNHEMLLCSICVDLEHTKPCHVDYIPEISDKMINSLDFKHTIVRIAKLLKKCKKIKIETSRDANKSNDSLKNALQEIKKNRQEINKRMDELQKEIEDQIQSLQHQNDEQMKTVETICENIMKMVKVMYDNIIKENTSKQADQLFMEIKQAQKQLQDYEQSISFLSTDNCMDEYKFNPNQTINDVLQKEKMIGDISAKHQAKADSSPQCKLLTPSAGTITPTCSGEICVKSSEDKERCYITGMTVVSPDRLVLVDIGNISIKLVDVNSKSITSQLSLGTEYAHAPSDITSTASTQVAVTVPHRQHIQFITVLDTLSKSHTIHTDGVCRGICCHQDKLVVTYSDPWKLEILDMKGSVITRVDTRLTGKDVFGDPGFIQANSSFIYVSDEGFNEVIMLKWTGEITGRITDIEYPQGIALLDDGSLLVCDHNDYSTDYADDRVYQVSGCTSSRIVLQDVICPRAICADVRGQHLYISRLAGDDKLNNNILLYETAQMLYTRI